MASENDPEYVNDKKFDKDAAKEDFDAAIKDTKYETAAWPRKELPKNETDVKGPKYYSKSIVGGKKFFEDGKKPPTQQLDLIGPNKNIPIWKCMDFWFDGGFDGKGMTNWRKISDPCGIDFSSDGNAVNDNVLLIPDNLNLEFATKLKLGTFSSPMNGKSMGIMDILKFGSEFLTGTKIIPSFVPKTFEDLDPLSIPGEFKFKFRYGQAGLYSGFEEVVKPIVALCLVFGVRTGGDTGNVTSISTPWPTSNRFMAMHFAGIASQVKGFVKNGALNVFSGESSGGFSRALNQLNATVQSLMASGSSSLAFNKSHTWKNLYVDWGRFTFGPLVYESIKYSFDMNSLDDHGWPTSGTFTIGGLSSLRKGTTRALISPIVDVDVDTEAKAGTGT